jgi:RNA polymerase sigma-70 factor (ECF subfamily)
VIAVAVDDEGLVARMVAGDDDAIGEVFDRYAPFLLGVARRVVRDTALAEDIVQEILSGLWSDPTRFDPARGSLRSFLGVQAHRRAVDTVRGEVRRQHREERYSSEGASRAEELEPIDCLADVQVIREAIEHLPDDQRAAVELAFWHGRTHREVAAVLAIPEGTAKSRLRLAQAKLAQLLAPFEGEPA